MLRWLKRTPPDVAQLRDHVASEKRRRRMTEMDSFLINVRNEVATLKHGHLLEVIPVGHLRAQVRTRDSHRRLARVKPGFLTNSSVAYYHPNWFRDVFAFIFNYGTHDIKAILRWA